MRSARIHAYGDLNQILIEDVPVPKVGPHEVLIRVEAAGLNPLDRQMVGGKAADHFPIAFPYAIGTDLAGTVVETGPLAARWRPGARVVARPDPVLGGALSEFVAVSAANVASAPEGLSTESASALPTSAGTAWQALFEAADLQVGQTVLVHGGAGGVGRFAVQLARLAGARVVTTVSTEDAEAVRALGADETIDYRSEDFTARLGDVDLVLDTVGGETQHRSFSVLRPGGALVSLVSPPDEALAAQHDVKASFVFHRTDAARLGLVGGLCEQGSLRVDVARTFALDDAAEALRFLASGHPKGKVVVSIQAP